MKGNKVRTNTFFFFFKISLYLETVNILIEFIYWVKLLYDGILPIESTETCKRNTLSYKNLLK